MVRLRLIGNKPRSFFWRNLQRIRMKKMMSQTLKKVRMSLKTTTLRKMRMEITMVKRYTSDHTPLVKSSY